MKPIGKMMTIRRFCMNKDCLFVSFLMEIDAQLADAMIEGEG